jgi:hypothetical protein
LIVAAGLLVLNPSIIGDAHAQIYANEYRYNSHYSEPKSPHTDIQKIKCVNSNINVNGIDITQIPQDNNVLAAAIEEGPDAATTQNDNKLYDKINFERNLVNICVNVNDNEQKVSPPETTLSVGKIIECTTIGTSPVPNQACDRLKELIIPSYFQIQVTGNNPNPSNFLASSIPIIVTLNPGNYNVQEIPGQLVQDQIDIIESGFPVTVKGPIVSFSGDCTHAGSFGQAEGTIATGESKICNINNAFSIQLAS